MNVVQQKNRRTVFVLCSVIAGMVALTAASVPLYQLFCAVTGYGGTTQRADAPSGPASDRMMTVRFNADTSKYLQWRFVPVQRDLTVGLGEEALAFYRATNVSDQTLTGTATFNVTPHVAGYYFNKMECFCFTEQTLEPGESIDMPVSFFVDPDIAKDYNTDHLDEITLSYTFFPKDTSKKSVDVTASLVE